ncbi:hypothetical protein CCACVL1_10698, partial [Corchorus capsularis]
DHVLPCTCRGNAELHGPGLKGHNGRQAIVFKLRMPHLSSRAMLASRP